MYTADDRNIHSDGERLTLAVWFSQDSSHDEDSNLVSRHASEQLMGSIQIAKGGELLTRKFTNILHALQVVQFHHWKVSELKASRVENDPVDELAAMSQPQDISAAITSWEDYTCKLLKKLLSSLPQWKMYQTVNNQP
ncbi:hypothetical protein BRARA_B01760 [Brassica rapa]|uniref:Uncharacterized protein n=1 Tax=Brassica campestris TaxID=3711 RepID=A0A398AHF0_BRACM|nr:hypothetical protein BRARA_B01760 [Brassica rapa]